MPTPKNKIIIDSASGNITSANSRDNIILMGVLPYEGNAYYQDVELTLNTDNSQSLTIKFPYDGYNLQLFIGDFNDDKKSEIMVRGDFGGSGGFEIGVIYEYDKNKLVELFNQDIFNSNNSCTATFKDNYKVHINCGDKKYSIDISSRPKNYLDLIYSNDGTVKPGNTVSIDPPEAIYPIKQVYNQYYNLLILQRIVGVVNADTLGVIQTQANLLNNQYNIDYKGLLLVPSPLEEKEKKM
ncbi:MAG: hypothetical protein ACRC92_11490 [Peptostreptococcaceae bacterium]